MEMVMFEYAYNAKPIRMTRPALVFALRNGAHLCIDYSTDLHIHICVHIDLATENGTHLCPDLCIWTCVQKCVGYMPGTI